MLTRTYAFLLLIVTVMLGARNTFAQDAPKASDPMPIVETVRLWNGDAPNAQGTGEGDVPTLMIYRPAPDKATGAAFVVCPGGGYGGLAEHEGKPVAQWLNTLGITGYVLKYRLGPRYHHPVEMRDAQRALRYVRAHAAENKIDPHRIGIVGFSAGGHLASTVATHFDAGDPKAPDMINRVSCRPDAAVLLYPVITMTDPFTHGGSRHNLLGDTPDPELVNLLSNERQITKQTPPVFLVHTSDDSVVPVENSLLFALACRAARVPCELHVYEHGPHGFGLGGNNPVLNTWPASCAMWLKANGFLTRPAQTASVPTAAPLTK